MQYPLIYPEKKTPAVAGVFISSVSLVVAGNAEDVQQADEDVEDTQKDSVGGHDVVRLAAIDDAAGIKQNKAWHQHDDCSRDGQRQGGTLNEQAGNDCQYHHHHTGKQETAEKAEIFFAGKSIAWQAKENNACTAEGSGNNLRAIWHRHVDFKYRTETETEQTGDQKDNTNACRWMGCLR